MVTIRNDHIKDLKKVKSKIMVLCKDELADATIDPKDYKSLIEEHLNVWHERAYTTLEPVRFIGLQVLQLPSLVQISKQILPSLLSNIVDNSQLSPSNFTY